MKPDALTVRPGEAVTYHNVPPRPAPAPAPLPSLGDRARLLGLFDAALEMPLVRLDVLERNYPCASETLRAWARANRVEIEQDRTALRLRVNGWVLICVSLATGGAA